MTVASEPRAASDPLFSAPRFSGAHVPALDGVRGIAILLVIAYHFSVSLGILGVGNPLLGFFRFGWCGVDVFFALSGFLITGILLDTKDSPHYFRNFYVRRVLRIFPLYYGSLLVVFLLRLALPQAGVWGAHGTLAAPGSLLWPLLYLQNLGVYLGGPSLSGVTTHYWSLAVEEHFYLAWPLLVWLATRRQITLLAMTAIVVSLLGRALVYWHGSNLEAIFGLTPLRMDGLAIGALASIALRRQGGLEAVLPWARTVMVVAGVALVGLLAMHRMMHHTDPAMWLIGYPLVAMVTAAALLLSLRNGPVARILSLSPLRWFGKYSFGLYVWHPIIGVILLHSHVALVPDGAGQPAVVLAALATLLIDLAVAWLSFHLWEKRFLDMKRFFAADTPRRLPPEAGARIGAGVETVRVAGP
jgi:peptidoglycan/LPS O-acetylase OafA/YrhL